MNLRICFFFHVQQDYERLLEIFLSMFMKIPIAISSERKNRKLLKEKARLDLNSTWKKEFAQRDWIREKNRRKQLNHFLITNNWNRNWLIASLSLPISSYREQKKKEKKCDPGWLGRRWNENDCWDWIAWSTLDKEKRYWWGKKLGRNKTLIFDTGKGLPENFQFFVLNVLKVWFGERSNIFRVIEICL
jgi:hypothetical protein